MQIGKRQVGLMGILRFISDVDEAYFDQSRRAVYARINNPKILSLDDYFPSQIKRIVGSLERKGLVKITASPQGTKVEITGQGKRQVLIYQLDEFVPKTGEWDGKWRIVFFDIQELKRNKRDKFRIYLKKLGFKQMQKSVWITPYNCNQEISYLREVLNIPHQVKLGLLEEIENDQDLRKWFGL